MIKRTLYFGNPAYLSKKDNQLKIELLEGNEANKIITVPIEDIGIIILDNPQITVTQAVMSGLIENNSALVTCAPNHIPNGLLLPLEGNHIQSERFAEQINASAPLKKQLWRQTVKAKIFNQALLLDSIGKESKNMKTWSSKVSSGDKNNLESRAAVYYWKNIFDTIPDFIRQRDGDIPNSFLNYGYAVLRAITARSLVGSGLLPTLGIHHHNKYNAYCLADDIMEPYRPYVDAIVLDILNKFPREEEITKDIKKMILELAVKDVKMEKEESPLMIAMQRTTASLAKCFAGDERNLLYPLFS